LEGTLAGRVCDGGCLRAPRFTRNRFDGKVCRANVEEESNMRNLMTMIVMAAGLSLVGAATASAAPANGQAIAKASDHASYVTDVAGGCGAGWHRDRFGHCVP